jgi:hypothetical protein
MNEHRRAGRGRHQRMVVLAAALSGLVIVTAGCGSSSPTGPAGGGGSTPYQEALAYAQCMRSHGEPRFPDPDSQGQFKLTGPEIGPLGSPRYLSASNACEHLTPKIEPMTAARKRENVSQALKYSACMRSNGITTFPEPIVSNGGAAVGWRMSGIDQNSPQFHSAQQACRDFEPGLAGGGPP